MARLTGLHRGRPIGDWRARQSRPEQDGLGGRPGLSDHLQTLAPVTQSRASGPALPFPWALPTPVHPLH